MSIDILYSDNDIAVCVKPAGVISENGGMPELLKSQLGGEFYCVHRLDREVSGVMVYAGNTAAAAKLSAQVSGGEFSKEYLAVAGGIPEPSEGIMEDLLFHDSSRNKSFVVKKERRGVKKARLEYRCIESIDYRSLVSVKLITGRTHQIRVQFAARKMPLLGDRKYGGETGCRTALISREIAFLHPATGEKMRFCAEVPAEYPWNLFSQS